MTKERAGFIQFGGVDHTVVGEDVVIGQTAPEFTAVGQDWSEISPIAQSKGDVLVLASVPSLETSVCDRETRRFNEEAVKLGEGVHIYVLSMDLPFTQKRWCGAAGVDRVTTLSDHKYADFGPKYGVLIKEKRLLRRAVFVINREGKVVYSDYMPVLGEEPDYEQVLAAVEKALG